MRKSRTVVGIVLGTLLAVPLLLTSSPAATASGATPSATAASATVEADWELNDPAGSRVMVDSTGRHDGAIGPDATAEGLTLNGSAYTWSLRCPACLPAAPDRVVKVPDSSALDIPDPSVTWSAEFRFKTNKGYGNIMQKGQAKAVGGQIKIENPNGYTQCVFIGANGKYVVVPSPIRLNDNVWHVFKCVHTASQIQVWVDGSQVASKNFVTGPIDNAKPFVIGGKPNCDQVTITCDYYTGQIDWVRITRGDGSTGDQPPKASFTSSCSGLACTFNSAGSSDPEGGALSYAWTFGDGGTSTQASPSHTYAAAGTYPVELTVTDPGGQVGTLTRQVTVGTSAGDVAFRAVASSNTNVAKPSVTVPSGVQAGDALVLLATTNRAATTSPPAGWTLLGTRTDGSDLRSWAFTRTATAGLAGSKVTLALDATSKTSLTLVAYSGAGPVTTAASAAETSSATTTHASPPVAVAADGSWVLSSWVDKTAAPHAAWVLPAAVTPRNANAGTGAGVVTAATGDSGPVSAGTWPGLTATSGAASAKAISWSIVIPPA